MIPEVVAGIVTSVAIIVFVAVNIFRFNKHVRIH
jgi:uncharacterized membrane protein